MQSVQDGWKCEEDQLEWTLNGQLRIQQTIKSQEGLIVIYKITNLLQFYLITMRRTIGDQATLCKTIEE